MERYAQLIKTQSVSTKCVPEFMAIILDGTHQSLSSSNAKKPPDPNQGSDDFF